MSIDELKAKVAADVAQAEAEDAKVTANVQNHSKAAGIVIVILVFALVAGAAYVALKH